MRAEGFFVGRHDTDSVVEYLWVSIRDFLAASVVDEDGGTRDFGGEEGNGLGDSERGFLAGGEIGFPG